MHENRHGRHYLREMILCLDNDYCCRVETSATTLFQKGYLENHMSRFGSMPHDTRVRNVSILVTTLAQ
jgi:hypothetical protein